MKNLICTIIGHDVHTKNFYPSDPITTSYCHRCDEILDEHPNPMYTPHPIYINHPWEQLDTFTEEDITEDEINIDF